MGVEWVAGILIVLALVFVAGAVVLFLGKDWLLQWLRGTAGVLLVLLAGQLTLVAASLFGYQQVPAGGGPLATLSFERSGPQDWMVTVSEANGDQRRFNLLGDLWELDVRLLRYAGPLSVLDVNPSFRLERLSGRYIALEDQEQKDNTTHGLLPEPFLGYDIWERAERHGSLFLDASRSSLVLVPVAEGAIFEVGFGERGLTLNPANSAAETALRGIGE